MGWWSKVYCCLWGTTGLNRRSKGTTNIFLTATTTNKQTLLCRSLTCNEVFGPAWNGTPQKIPFTATDQNIQHFRFCPFQVNIKNSLNNFLWLVDTSKVVKIMTRWVPVGGSAATALQSLQSQFNSFHCSVLLKRCSKNISKTVFHVFQQLGNFVLFLSTSTGGIELGSLEQESAKPATKSLPKS